MWLKKSLLSKSALPFVLVLAIGLIIRAYGITVPPHSYDMGTFHAWGNHMLSVGPKDFYGTTWSDYLPFPLYFLAPIAGISAITGISFALIFKTILSLVEVGLIVLIAKFLRGRSRLLVFSLLMLSPALIGDTAVWGQVDTVPSLLTLLSLVASSPILFGLAVAFKPIMILVAPVLWITEIKKGRWWQFPLVSGLTFLSTGIPIAGLSTFRLLWERTVGQAGTYPYTTVNAWNAWSLVANPSSWLPDNQIVLGLSGHTTGLLLFGVMALLVLNQWRRVKFAKEFAPRIAATILIVFFTFATRMHERHLLFGLPLLALAIASQSWLLVPLVLYSLFFVLNLFGAYYWVLHDQIWPFEPWVMSTVAWGTTLTSIALATIWDWPSFVRSKIMLFKSHKILIAILLLASCLRLINLSYPDTYIFDEVYHGFTAREYLHDRIEAWEWWTTPPSGVAYEWTHPPLAKYGMVIGMRLFGETSFGWRVGSAIFGVISIYGLYLLVLSTTSSRKIALLSAFILSVEGLHLAQSRLAMNDIYMLAFFIWSLYAAVKSRWKTASILFGLALASKWSALYGLVPLAVIYLNQNWLKLKTPLLIVSHVLHVLRYILIALGVYILSFAPFILAGHTWEQWWELHRQMWYYHTHLVATHAYQSSPLQWIFSARPVWYYVKYLETNISNIYAQSNPLILWLGLVAVVLQIKKVFNIRYSLFFVLYLVFTLPWIFSPRIMFFYHYLPSATFLTVILASWLVSLPKRFMWLAILLFVISFTLISPMLYGTAMPHAYWDTLFGLFPSWK